MTAEEIEAELSGSEGSYVTLELGEFEDYQNSVCSPDPVDIKMVSWRRTLSLNAAVTEGGGIDL